MSDWVHCNKCGVMHTPKNSFFLMECGHIFCNVCTDKIRLQNICMTCRKPGKIILLSNNLEPNIKTFFTPIEDMIKKTAEVYNFQLQQRKNLFKVLLTKYNAVKKENITLKNNIRSLMKELAILRSAGKGAQFHSSTPTSSTGFQMNFTPHNSSIVSSIPTSMKTSTPNNVGMNVGQNNTFNYHGGLPKRMTTINTGSSGPYSSRRVPDSTIPQSLNSLEELRRSRLQQVTPSVRKPIKIFR